jgi:hypothetical protein
MSNALAVAAVTAVLKSILSNGITEAKLSAVLGGDVAITSLPPDRVPLNGGQDPNQLNIFLYQTSYNSGWRNVGYPSRSASGARLDNPPLALNLHYILSAYGAQDYFPEIILGYGMQALHENPVLMRGAIQRALAPPVPPPGLPKELAGSRLAEQVEQVTVTSETLTTEEISRLWTALQARYRPSMAYQVTVVLVESTRSTRGPLPVAAPTSGSLPFATIVIDSIDPATGPATPILPTSTLLISGQNLRADDTRLLIGGQEFPLPANQVTAKRITFLLPNPLPPGFYAGLLGVQVVHGVSLGSPPTAHSLFKSAAFAIVLRPTITPLTENMVNTVIDGVTYRSGDVRVDFAPKVGRAQSVVVLLNEFNPPSSRRAYAYSFPAPPDNGITDPTIPDTATIRFPFRNILPGSYLVRVQVDGAESVLTMAAGLYANPQVTV